MWQKKHLLEKNYLNLKINWLKYCTLTQYLLKRNVCKFEIIDNRNYDTKIDNYLLYSKELTYHTRLHTFTLLVNSSTADFVFTI